ncbi:hypothetical protein Pint_26579 [Pistacia integerrima]|uniref:Uncharacterized protein n=1 Tax=Pistacia integerrima TaxID=434235 RepID=A0ACC0YQ70_9ROSI|nr:hypothetical protein Pint_26579 [Pistacia integerrima]
MLATPIFSWKHYTHWAKRMKTMLKANGLWDIVYDGYKELEDDVEYTIAQKKENKEKSQKNSRALASIQSGVNKAIFLRILIEEEAKIVWEIDLSSPLGVVKNCELKAGRP